MKKHSNYVRIFPKTRALWTSLKSLKFFLYVPYALCEYILFNDFLYMTAYSLLFLLGFNFDKYQVFLDNLKAKCELMNVLRAVHSLMKKLNFEVLLNV